MERAENLERFKGKVVKKYDSEFLFYSNFLKPLKEAIDNYGIGDILDIGCGNKPYLQYFTNQTGKYIGCDVVQSSLGTVDVLCEATKIPLPNSEFDTVISTQVIEHVSEPQQMIHEAYRLLKPNGYLIISSNMYWPLHEEPYDFFRFTKHGFRHILETAGFEVVSILPNGGKWAVFGQVFFQTIPWWLVMPKFVKWFFNSLFNFLDKRFFDDRSTINYVVVGRKKND
jgi:SAM-dependent methyltransferase